MTDVEKGFDGFTLRIDSLRLEPNRVHGLIGPNGSGKSTAMKLMAGLLTPDSGRIDHEGLSPREITMVPRKPYLLHGSVHRNLVYPLSLRGIRPDRDAIDRHLALAGLTGGEAKYAPSLSSGEQQKLALVRALLFAPKLILVDEAFSNLDVESVATFERLILERQRSAPITWVVISHQLAHIQRLCDHVCFMDGGRLEAHGPTEQMLLRPEHPKLRQYLRCEAIRATGLEPSDEISTG